MNFDWILNPLTQYAALAAGLIGCLALFISTKAEMSRFRRRLASAAQTAPVDTSPMVEEIERLNQAVRELQEIRPATPAASINLTRRTQVIRMHDRGEPVQTIAAALQVPAGEIELMLKLQRLTSAGARQAS
jgi:hypothetical protein